METHNPQHLYGTRMALPYGNLFMCKEERTIILAFPYLIYFGKHFIEDIFLILLRSQMKVEKLMKQTNH